MRTPLEIASYTNKESFPKEHALKGKGPQHFNSWAQPYLPPGIALFIDFGGLTNVFFVFLVCTFSTEDVHLCLYFAGIYV